MQYRHLDAHTPYLQLCMSHTPPSNLYHPYHQLKSGSFPKTHPPHKESEVVQSSPTLCNPRDCSLPGFSVCGIFQARVLEWVAISFSRGSSWPRDWTQVSCIVGSFFTIWATREAHERQRTCNQICSFFIKKMVAFPVEFYLWLVDQNRLLTQLL